MFPIAFNTLFEYLVTRVLASLRFPAEMEMTLVKSLHKTIKHVLPDYLVTDSDLLTAFPNFWMYGAMFYNGFSVTAFFFPPAVHSLPGDKYNSGNITVSYL
jgi:hypothetical protein